MNYSASTQSDIKLKNQKIILRLLLKEGAMSRADLAKKMETSKPTISKNVDGLLSQGMLVEKGKDDNRIGKKGTLIDVNDSYAHVLALDLSKNKLHMVLADLRGRWLDEFQVSMETLFHENQEKEGLENIIKAIEVQLQKNVFQKTNVAQIVMAYPGVVGHNERLYLSNVRSKEGLLSRLHEILSKSFNAPIRIKNDLNLAVIAEKHYGPYEDKKSLCLINSDMGVGLGIIIEGKLYEGDRNAAGEVGFVLPVQHSNGRFYTLEERIGLHALLKRCSTKDKEIESVKALKEALVSGDETVSTIYESAIQDLAMALSNVASILDIESIVAVGGFFDLRKGTLDVLSNLVSQMTPFNTRIKMSYVEDQRIKGAILFGTEAIVDDMI